MQPDDNLHRTNRPLIVVIVIIITIALATTYLLWPRQSDKTGNPASTASSKEKEEVKTTYTGEKQLLARGLLLAQIEATKIALTNYAHSQNKNIKQTAFSNVTHDISNGPDGDIVHTYGFTVSQDGSIHRATLELVSNQAIRMRLYEPKDPTRQVYDSRVIDLATQSQD